LFYFIYVQNYKKRIRKLAGRKVYKTLATAHENIKYM